MKIILFATLAICITTVASCQQTDLSTNEAVVRLYCDETGADPLEAVDWLCIERIKGHDNVIVVGSFEHDAGCFMEAIIVDGKMGHWDKMNSMALAAMG
jgi:hypothetical protein